MFTELAKFFWNVAVFLQSLFLFITSIFSNIGADKDVKTIHITIDNTAQYQEIDGFGATACWWAQIAGKSDNAEELTKLLYSIEGLGLNIFRYNIGGGERENPESRLDKNSWNSTESFLVYNEKTGEYEYDWNQDAGARKILDLALSYGCVDTVVLFANSPHFSMTDTGHASGGFVPYHSNLPEENYQAYADYLLDIAEHFIDEGIPVKYLSPFNEPHVRWGGDEVYQEGCHFSRKEVAAFTKVLAKSLKERGLDIKLCLGESSKICLQTYQYIKDIYKDEEILSVLGTYTYHSYWADGNYKLREKLGKTMAKKYPGLRYEMSEWSELPCTHTTDSIESALIMARVLSQDMAIAGCNAWTAWAPVHSGDNYSDGMIITNDDCSEYYIAKRYNALAHFSKFIPQGSVRISAEKNVNDRYAEWIGDFEFAVGYRTNVSAYLTPDGETVLVIVNEDSAKDITLNLTDGNMTIYTTDEKLDCEKTYEGKIQTFNIPENSITTIIIK